MLPSQPDVSARLVHSAKGVMEQFECSKPHALAIIHAAGAIHIGRRIYVADSDLRRYLESQREPSR